MTLLRWQPFSEIATLQQQLDRIFDDFVNIDYPQERKNTWQPAVELQENETNFVLRAVIPGVAAEDLDVQVSRDRIVIKGEHRYDQKEALYSEFRYGSFERTLALPAKVENEQVEAEFTNGILTLTLPKLEVPKNSVFKVNLTASSGKLEAPQEEAVKEEKAEVKDADSLQEDVWDSEEELVA